MATESFDTTIGALLLGVLIAGCLWGVSCAQLWNYVQNYPDDSTGLKVLVWAAWTSDTVHQGLITYALYFYAVTHFGDVSRLEDTTPVLAMQTFIQGLTAFLVQCFLVHRVWTMSNNSRWLTIGMLMLILAQLSLVTLQTVSNYRASTYTQLALELKLWDPLCAAVTTAADLALAITLCVLLRRGTTGLTRDYVAARTSSVVNRLMFYTMSTGLLTGVFSITILVAYLSAPHSYVYIALYFIIGRLYVNSLLVALNVRSAIRGMWAAPRAFSFRSHADTRPLSFRFDSSLHPDTQTTLELGPLSPTDSLGASFKRARLPPA